MSSQVSPEVLERLKRRGKELEELILSSLELGDAEFFEKITSPLVKPFCLQGDQLTYAHLGNSDERNKGHGSLEAPRGNYVRSGSPVLGQCLLGAPEKPNWEPFSCVDGSI